MKSIKQSIKSIYSSIFLLLISTQQALAAADIKAPNWVRKADRSDISAAGEEINLWVFAIMIVIIAIFAVKPGYLLITGKQDEALEASKNILLGAAIAVVFGGVVFAVMGKFS